MSVKYPNKKDRGICKSCMGLNFRLRRIICPKSKTQFETISHVPKEIKVNFMLTTFAIEEIGETPSSACFVKATPTPQKNRLIMNNK